ARPRGALMLAIILGTLGVVIVTVAIGMLIDRKVSLLPTPDDLETKQQRERKKLVGHGAGEAPATVLHRRDAQIAKLRASQRCTGCQAMLRNDADASVRYGDRELLVLHYSCASCGPQRSLYIDHPTTLNIAFTSYTFRP